MIIRNGIVFAPDATFTEADLAVEDGKIVQLAPPGSLPGADVLDAAGGYVLPGFVDIHTHGAAGCDFCDADPVGLPKMLAYYAGHGVTSVVAATMSLREEMLAGTITAALPYFDTPGYGAVLRGIHMEGPFVSREKKGAQNAAFITDPDAAVFDRLQALAIGHIRLVDIAPEAPGAAEFIRHVKNSCVVSLAHSAATYDMAAAAFDAGATHVTHLFNAMLPFAGREPGLIGAASDKAAFVELISDGVHLHPAVVRAVFRWFGPQRVCLVSDSISAAGMPDGTYTLGGQRVLVSAGEARLADGTIAGGVANLADGCRRAVGFGVPLEQAVRAATSNPAEAAGIADVAGSLAPGRPADIVLWDGALRQKCVWVAGRVVRE